MAQFLTIENIMFAVNMVGIIFLVYNSFRTPQIRSEENDSIFALRLDTLEDKLVNLRDNHVHTLDVRIQEQSKNVETIMQSLVRLETKLEERLPKKV